jgi:transposase
MARSFQGKEFTPEMKQLVINLKLHFDEERKKHKEVSTRNPTLRTAKGLGIGEITVKRIMAEYRQHGHTREVYAAKPRGKPEYRAAVNLQPVIREYIPTKNLAGQRVGVEKLRHYLLETHGADIPPVTLWRTLQRWGFTYGTGKRRSALKEHDYVVLARRRYLRQKRANRNPDGSLKRPEVYLDETFVNKNHSGQFTWYLEEDGPWVNKPSGKGPRLIIVHAMTGLGWVPGAELIFEAAKRTGDYHGQMNWENFSMWFSDQLLPNIPSHSLIILDNAPYHNVVVEDAFPTPKSRKEQLCAWLTKKGIPWTPDMLKPELYDLCKKCAPAPEYRLDQLAEASGHRLLRTPQYHPELQPIETCWGIVKNYMADQCDFTTQNFHKQLPIALSKVKPSTCRKLIAKVVEQEEKYWAEDEQLYEHDFDEISDGEECATD